MSRQAKQLAQKTRIHPYGRASLLSIILSGVVVGILFFAISLFDYSLDIERAKLVVEPNKRAAQATAIGLSTRYPVSPDGPGTTVSCTTSGSCWSDVDEDPYSANTSDYIYTIDADGRAFFNVDLPSDIGRLIGAQIKGQYSVSGIVDDWVDITYQWYSADGTTPLTNENWLVLGSIMSNTSSTFTRNISESSFFDTGWSSSALLAIGINHTSDMGSDGVETRINALEITSLEYELDGNFRVYPDAPDGTATNLYNPPYDCSYGPGCWYDLRYYEYSQYNYTYNIRLNSQADAEINVNLTEVPASYASMDSMYITIGEGSLYINYLGDDNYKVYAQLVQSDESTAVSDEVLVADTALGEISGVQSAKLTNISSLTADEWSDVMLKLRFDFTANMGGDGAILRIGDPVYIDAGDVDALAPALTQEAYRWRYDDGSESAATWLAAENASATISETELRRLRFSVLNDGLTTSTAAYRLEYATATSGPWTAVGAPSSPTAHWVYDDSSYLTDGATTSDVSGLSEPLFYENVSSTTFVAGETKDAGNTTGNITLESTAHTEVEFAITPTSTATAGGVYYFRLTNSGTVFDRYDVYASAIASSSGTSVPDLQQIHYRWRDDSASEGTDSGWLTGSEDTAITNIAKGTSTRLRIQISNEGDADSSSTQYRLEYATSTSGPWTQVQTSGTEWIMYNATNLTDGNTTTDNAGLSNANTTFVAGQQKDTGSQTTGITLTSTQFTELEYAITPDTSAVDGETYYFRVTNAGGTTNMSFPAYPAATLETPVADTITVNTTGTQTATSAIPSTDLYLGGAFTFVRDSGTTNVTQIVVSETGTVNANSNLSNLRLYYETAATCDYAGTETLFGSSTFDGSENATITGTMSVGTSQVCVYAVVDVGSGASGSETIDIEITDPSTEVTVGAGVVSPGSALAISGSTTLQAPGAAALTQIHYRWRLDDNNEANATWAAAEDTPITDVATGTARRLRIEVSNEGTGDSSSTAYRLEYATSTSGTWTQVGSSAHWYMVDSSWYADGVSSTDVVSGLTNENTTFRAGQLKGTGSQTSGITLTSSEYTEIEFNIAASSSATLGATYYFRLTNAGATSSFTYAKYASATLASAPVDLRQMHYRWRNDDGGEASSSGASSAEYLLPDGAGTYTGWKDAASESCAGTALYTSINDATSSPDDSATTACGDTENAESSFHIESPSGSGSIDSVQLVIRSKQSADDEIVPKLLIGGTLYPAAANITPGTAYGTASATWTTNPSNSQPWQTSDLTNTQISFQGVKAGNPWGSNVMHVTQAYLQVNYSGSEESAATFVAAEDTSLSNLSKGTTTRLRIEVSNEGGAASASTQYRLQYATSTGASSWTSVGTGAHWVMAASDNITDGEATSNIDPGLTDEATTFVAGELKDTGNQTTGITLNADEFTELEYAIMATSSATDGETYYFRVSDAGTDLDTYTIYASATLAGAAPGSADLQQIHYRWRNDDGGEDMDTTYDTEITYPDVTSPGDSYLGDALAGGDINGDGYEDAVVSARCSDVAGYCNGAVYIYLGSSTGISSTPDIKIYAPEVGGDTGISFGESVAVGNFNGDAYSDLLVGARYANGSGTDNGAAYIYFGAAGTSMVTSSPGKSIYYPGGGSETSAQFGTKVAAGNFNGDAYDDALIGAEFSDASGTDNGAAYLYWGASGTSMATAPGKSFYETLNATSTRYSRDLASGDFNGDSFDDALISAVYYNGGTRQGRAYIYFGATGTTMDTAADKELTSGSSNDAFGVAVTAGDFNGDTYADALIGADLKYYSPEADGAAYIFFGAAGSGMDTTIDKAFAKVSSTADGFGLDVAAGDLNGDGFADALIGARYTDASGSDNGSMHLFYGASGTLMSTSSTKDIYYTRFEGAYFGENAATGDFNNDGYDDALIGAFNASPLLNRDGAAYVYLGGGATWAAAEDAPVTGLSKGSSTRVRFQVSNEGAESSSSTEYRLEYSESISGPWTQVGAAGHWNMSDSAYITDGTSTMDIGGITNEGSTFVPGQMKDAGNQATGITLGVGEYTELEYSIVASTSATNGGTYYFRLTDAGATSSLTYTKYASATLTAGPEVVVTQSNYRWYSNESNVTPAVALADENTVYDSATVRPQLRLRMNIGASGAELASGQTFKLQFSTATSSGWADVGAIDSGVAWRGYNTASVADGTTLSVSKLSNTTILETYEESNNATATPNAIPSGGYGEFDWVLENNTNATGTTYYFRMIYANDTPLDDYARYPSVTTVSEASWRADEDTATSTVQGENIRLRVSVANTSVASSGAYKLEYAAKPGGGCSDVVSWTAMPTSATTEHWEMATSTHFINKASTTAARMTNSESYSYVTGQAVDADTGVADSISLGTSEYTELEFVFRSTGNSTDGQTYCFRVVNGELDGYDTYPELTVGAPSAAALTQTHYRWRNDDGDESAATWAASEDAPITALTKETLRRLRIQVWNNGSSSDSAALRLEYATSATTTAGAWTALGSANHWEAYGTANITDGSGTTNIAGVTDAGSVFVAGEQKDANTDTGSITLDADEFTEIEWAIRATTNAVSGDIYYFRLTNAGAALNTYDIYASTTLSTATFNTSGTLDSLIIDTTKTRGVTPNSFRWQGTQPANTAVKFQFASADNAGGPWVYKAWNPATESCDPDAYYNPGAPEVNIEIQALCHVDHRYIRYRIILETTDPAYTPEVQRIILNYAQ